MTQRETVLKMLRDAGSEGVSSKTFIAHYMPRAAARIQELRKAGVEITSEREGKYVRYRIVGVGAGTLASPGNAGLPGNCREASIHSGDSPEVHDEGSAGPSLPVQPVEAQTSGEARLFALPSMSAQTNREAA